jgi:glucosyl-dolichyl phosphate glucuronosyltransferase
MTISVIICTRNRLQELVRCVNSIAIQTRLPDEIVIVDSSDDDHLHKLLKYHSFKALPIRYFHTEPGLTRQRNIGIKESSGNILFFPDDDVVWESYYIEKILKVYEKDTEGIVGGVQGLITNIGGQSWKRELFQKIFMLEVPGRGVMRASGLKEYLDIGDPLIHNCQDDIPVSVFSGCVMSYRREICDKFKFDENLSRYCLMEDLDYSYRVSQRYKLYHTSKARAEHLPSFGGLNIRDIHCQFVLNHYYLFRKLMPQNLVNILAYVWSNLGRIVFVILFRRGQRKAALWGIMDGYRQLLRRYGNR